MAVGLEDLRVLKAAEDIADSVWKRVIQWDDFAKEVVGKQFARATDSIGANIAESFGRFHFGEKLSFLYYARGNLFETKYWINLALTLGLLSTEDHKQFAKQLTDIVRQINSFATSLKSQRSQRKGGGTYKTLRETATEHWTDPPDNFPEILFDESDLNWLAS